MRCDPRRVVDDRIKPVDEAVAVPVIRGSRRHVGQRQPLDTLRGRPVAALCGIGNPAGFRHTLDRCGFQVVDFREFPDHHRYGPDDVESLGAWADGLDVEAVLCTHKDLVKLRVERLGQRPLMAVTIEMAILSGQEALESRLERLLPDAGR